MKLRVGFVSNSSTASFVVKTRPSEWDILLTEIDPKDIELMTLPQEKVDLLKKLGFYPTIEMDPFAKEMGRIRRKTKNDTFLTFSMTCNHDFGLQFLVANDIPFKASVHYGHHLYSYEAGDDYIYVLNNFGIEFLHNPKEFEERLNNPEITWVDGSPMKKINKKEYLKDYDEKESIALMTGKYPAGE